RRMVPHPRRRQPQVRRREEPGRQDRLPHDGRLPRSVERGGLSFAPPLCAKRKGEVGRGALRVNSTPPQLSPLPAAKGRGHATAATGECSSVKWRIPPSRGMTGQETNNVQHRRIRFGSMQARVFWRYVLLLALCALAGIALAAPLPAQWSFRLLPGDAQLQAHPGLDAWRPAQVPGSVHTDLLAAGLIGDPYAGAAEAGLQWIGLADWEYRARFDVDAATLARPHAELRFDGLDTFAEVSLNGRPLLTADNAHRTWRARVDGRLRATGNELRIVFRSPIRTLLPRVQAMPHRIAGNYPSPYGDEPADAMVGNFVRKPAYHFGWDWGPRYVTAGVWRGVQLESWDARRITDLAVRTDALNAQRAALSVQLQVENAAAGKARVAVEMFDPEGKRVAR